MRRNKIETFLDVLEALILHGPLRVTHLMRRSNVPWNRLKRYLSFAVENLAVNKRGTTYSVTPLGVLLYKSLNCFWQKRGDKREVR